MLDESPFLWIIEYVSFDDFNLNRRVCLERAEMLKPILKLLVFYSNENKREIKNNYNASTVDPFVSMCAFIPIWAEQSLSIWFNGFALDWAPFASINEINDTQKMIEALNEYETW